MAKATVGIGMKATNGLVDAVKPVSRTMAKATVGIGMNEGNQRKAYRWPRPRRLHLALA